MSRSRLILADDHQLLLEGLEAILRPHYDVVARATNGKALVEATERLRPDVVVSDVSMPELDGLSATIRIRERCPETKVVLVTMLHDPATARQALRIGASAYVLKTEAGKQLVTAIEEVLKGGTYVGPVLDIDGAGPGAEPAITLTPRQLEVLDQLGQGLTMKEIGRALCISARTVAFHKYRIMEQLGIETNAELLRYVDSLKRGGRSV